MILLLHSQVFELGILRFQESKVTIPDEINDGAGNLALSPANNVHHERPQQQRCK